jgi:hypothetical protein
MGRTGHRVRFKCAPADSRARRHPLAGSVPPGMAVGHARPRSSRVVGGHQPPAPLSDLAWTRSHTKGRRAGLQAALSGRLWRHRTRGRRRTHGHLRPRPGADRRASGHRSHRPDTAEHDDHGAARVRRPERAQLAGGDRTGHPDTAADPQPETAPSTSIGDRAALSRPTVGAEGSARALTGDSDNGMIVDKEADEELVRVVLAARRSTVAPSEWQCGSSSQIWHSPPHTVEHQVLTVLAPNCCPRRGEGQSPSLQGRARASTVTGSEVRIRYVDLEVSGWTMW